MAGKQGAMSDKPTDVTLPFRESFLDDLDGRVSVAKQLRCGA